MGYCLHHCEKEIAKVTHCIPGSINKYLTNFAFKFWTKAILDAVPQPDNNDVCLWLE